MRYGITGTRSFYPQHYPILFDLIDAMQDASEVTTGGCKGIDAALGELAAIYLPSVHHRVILPANRSQIAPWYERYSVEIIECPKGTDYRYRNEQIVEHSDRVLAIPYIKLETPRSGTWMTANIAKRAGKLWKIEPLPKA